MANRFDGWGEPQKRPGTKLLHTAESKITSMVPVGNFILVTTQNHGAYFINFAGHRVLLPIGDGPSLGG